MAQTKDPQTHVADFIKADTDRVVFTGNPHTDNLMTVVIALGAEVWADRKRLRVLERLLETKGKVTREMVEQYVPSSEEQAAWDLERDRMVRRVYDVLQRDADASLAFEKER
jgi:hypothetical protein